MPKTRCLAVAAAIAAAILAAQTPKPSSTDAELERAIRDRFARSKIAVNNFTVRVQGGVATLEGRTDVIQHKGTATRLARASGARQVVNKIEISEKAREKAAANLAKGRRRAQIKRGEPRSERSPQPPAARVP
ncbi:MAG: BON domain-containing protein [Acidobacteriota bacterium]